MNANAAAMFQMHASHYNHYRPGCWHPGPRPVPVNSWHGNLPDAHVGTKGWLFRRPVHGYGIDLNGNGRYDRGQDGVLAFDLNRDGKVSREEIERSNEMLKAHGGNNDLNGDGKVTICERGKAKGYRQEMARMDRDGDGRLSTWELAQGGGRVLIDRDRNGKFSPWESHSPYNFPTPGFGRGRLDYVDPFSNHSQVNHGWRWSYPPHFQGPSQHHHHHHHYHR